jgi:2Fe-2S ferredoxin
MPKIVFVLPNGDLQEEDAADGQSVMEVAKTAGIEEIFAECGGSLSCATCHVHVDKEWSDALPPVEEAEQDMLDGVTDLRPESRLSCQIFMTDAIDGIKIKVLEAQF